MNSAGVPHKINEMQLQGMGMAMGVAGRHEYYLQSKRHRGPVGTQEVPDEC